jgi:hypothetical protein
LGFASWVHKELVEEDRVHPEDCYAVSRFHWIEGIPKKVCFAVEGAFGFPSFAEVVKR